MAIPPEIDKTRDVETQKAESVPLPASATRPDYSQLRHVQGEKAETALSEPQRPETIRSPSWAQSADRASQERSAIDWAKAAQQRLAERFSKPKMEGQEQARGEIEQQKQVQEKDR